jgi:hypothetical protein
MKMTKCQGKPNYMELGHKSLRKLVCMKPGSRQPTVLAGGPDIRPTGYIVMLMLLLDFMDRGNISRTFLLEH